MNALTSSRLTSVRPATVNVLSLASATNLPIAWRETPRRRAASDWLIQSAKSSKLAAFSVDIVNVLANVLESLEGR